MILLLNLILFIWFDQCSWISSELKMYVEKCELSIEFEMIWMWLASGTNEEANKNKAV